MFYGKVKYNFALLQQLSGFITSEILASNQSAPYITLHCLDSKSEVDSFVDGMGGWHRDRNVCANAS